MIPQSTRRKNKNKNIEGIILCLKHVTDCRLVKILISVHSANHRDISESCKYDNVLKLPK